MLSVLLVGLLAVACPLLGFMAWVRLPRFVVCPTCGSATDPISPEGPERLVARWIWRRWCSSCRWEGMGRRGPDLTRGPVGHRSGFRWGEDSAEPDGGFRWGEGNAEVDEGFRWGRDGAEADTGSRRADDSAEPGPGFRWGDEHPDGAGGRPRPRRSRPERGFRWGG